MSRNLKFNLIHNNQSIRTIDELREYCAIEQLLIDYCEGKLQRWLKALRCFDDIIIKIDSLSVENDLEIAQELVRILEIKQQIFEDYQAKLETAKMSKTAIPCFINFIESESEKSDLEFLEMVKTDDDDFGRLESNESDDLFGDLFSPDESPSPDINELFDSVESQAPKGNQEVGKTVSHPYHLIKNWF